MKIFSPIKRVWNFYKEGFLNMPRWGVHAWIIVFLKLVIVFIIMKFVFFPNYLKSNFDTNEERSNHVLEQLTKTE